MGRPHIETWRLHKNIKDINDNDNNDDGDNNNNTDDNNNNKDDNNNNKDDKDNKGISALGLDRSLGFLRGHHQQ